MARLGAETIIIREPSGEIDFFGKPTYEPDVTIEDCAIVPRTAPGEGAPDRDLTVISGLQVFCPPGTVVTAHAVVVARGLEYAVDGEPGDLRTRRGIEKAILVNLKRVTG